MNGRLRLCGTAIPHPASSARLRLKSFSLGRVLQKPFEEHFLVLEYLRLQKQPSYVRKNFVELKCSGVGVADVEVLQFHVVAKRAHSALKMFGIVEQPLDNRLMP
ncbi:hypothetical protein [Methylocystis sp.]|uniref:hypothetical protein n=1 Tax=Methylocystis sp. TaxID=1911079 RepID=UPI003D0E370B